MTDLTNSRGSDHKKFTHLNKTGEAHMVNISDKQPTYRTAIAQGQITMTPQTLARIRQDQVNKGDVLQVARIAAIMAGKKTSELIPLCHTIQVTSLEVNFTVNETLPGLVVEAEASSCLLYTSPSPRDS